MKINKLNPQGFCGGVNKALKTLDDTINNPSTVKPIYLLGSIIHNEHIIDEYKNKGVMVIEDKSKTRLELLDLINEGTVVFSAHGVSPKVYQKALNKGLNIIDTTCSNVSIIHSRIKEHLANGYTCIYIGNNHHPECEGILGINDSIEATSFPTAVLSACSFDEKLLKQALLAFPERVPFDKLDEIITANNAEPYISLN